MAAGDVACVFGVCERVVKEIHRGDSIGVSWTLLLGILKNSVKELHTSDRTTVPRTFIFACLCALVYLKCWFLP